MQICSGKPTVLCNFLETYLFAIVCNFDKMLTHLFTLQLISLTGKNKTELPQLEQFVTCNCKRDDVLLNDVLLSISNLVTLYTPTITCSWGLIRSYSTVRQKYAQFVKPLQSNAVNFFRFVLFTFVCCLLRNSIKTLFRFQ